MKHIQWIILLLTTLIYTDVFCQDLKASEVPGVVKDSLKAKYPDVYVYEWEKKKKMYEAEFIIKGIKYEALFTKEGIWVSTTRDIKQKDVPQEVWNSLSKTEYTAWKIDDIEEHNTPKYERLYEIELKLNKQKVVLYFTPDGTRTDPNTY